MMAERSILLHFVVLVLLGLTLEAAYTYAFTPSRLQQHKILHLGELWSLTLSRIDSIVFTIFTNLIPGFLVPTL